MKQKVSLMLLILLSIPSITHAYSDYIIASGENIGITVKTNGVLVVGTYTVGNELIIADSGLHIGDLITKVENQKVSTSDELLKKINSDECNNLNITYTRNNKEVYKKEKEEKEEASSDEEELDEPCINYKDIKQWEADNGKQWEGWIDWSD